MDMTRIISKRENTSSLYGGLVMSGQIACLQVKFGKTWTLVKEPSSTVLHSAVGILPRSVDAIFTNPQLI